MLVVKNDRRKEKPQMKTWREEPVGRFRVYGKVSTAPVNT